MNPYFADLYAQDRHYRLVAAAAAARRVREANRSRRRQHRAS